MTSPNSYVRWKLELYRKAMDKKIDVQNCVYLRTTSFRSLCTHY